MPSGVSNGTASDRLIEAINALQPSEKVQDHVQAAIQRMARFTMAGHATDFKRALERIDAATTRAEANRLAEEGEAAIEEALWRIDTAREKLITISSLAFGVPTLQPFKVKGQAIPTGITFRTNWSKLAARLGDLSRRHAAASDLIEILAGLHDHAATTLRNEISHGRAPIREAPMVVWLRLIQTREGKVVSEQQRYLWPQGMSDRKDIQADTLWEYALAAIHEAVDMLGRTADLLSKLVRAAAALEPGQAVYQDLDSGEISMVDPPARPRDQPRGQDNCQIRIAKNTWNECRRPDSLYDRRAHLAQLRTVAEFRLCSLGKLQRKGPRDGKNDGSRLRRYSQREQCPDRPVPDEI